MAGIHLTKSFILFFLALIFSQLITVSIVQARNEGFSIDLVHRDSPLSPYYNSSETVSDRLRHTARRLISRISSSVSPTTIGSTLISNGYEYLMKFSIGTPPIEMLAIADTGSDLTWTQCNPCMQCYSQDAPFFDPQLSSTYTELSCESHPCQSLDNVKCGITGNECEYSYSYMDKSFTNGALATETFTFDSATGSTVAIPKLIFGCGHYNRGSFSVHESGLVGLGGGSLSFASQLSSQIDGKFSYCFTPNFGNSTSKLSFGNEAVISGEGIVSTPLVTKDPKTFYFLTLEGITVGDKKVDNRTTDFNGSEGNIFIDSGTTLTALEASLYSELESAVKEAINQEPVEDPSRTFRLCYSNNMDIKLPEMTFHFTGADLVLKSMNTFVSASGELLCLSIIPSQSYSIFGNMAQVNFQVEYDLIQKKVSFAPADCTKR